MSDQVYDWDAWPFTLHIEEMARIVRRSVKTIRAQLKAKTFEFEPNPRTGKTAPYEWYRDKVRQQMADGETRPMRVAGPYHRNHFSKAKARRHAA